MSTKTQYIQRTEKVNPSTDFYALRKEGIAYIQELSGHMWTNFNPHDPGLILLETLCYALTELGYKSDFSITDLLQSIPNEKFVAQNNALYPKEDIFTTHPITVTDYRMLLIDHLAPIINNVWVEAIKNPKDEFIGKYIVWLLPDDQITFDQTTIVQKTFDCMAAHRNLGEEVHEVQFLHRKKAHIHAELQITNEAYPNKILAAFFHRLEEVFLNPTFRRYTEEELTAKGLSTDEIYDGPKINYGFFDKQQLKELPKSISIEELIQLFFQIDEGVLKVTNFKVFIEDQVYTETIPLDHFLPQFIATDPTHQFYCYQQGMQLTIDLEQVNSLIAILKQGQQRNYTIALQKQSHNSVKGTQRDIASFLPVDYDLPAIFGVGHQSLPKYSSLKDQQQRYQLTSYLQLMNTFLSNASKKLANVASFFSIQEKSFHAISKKSYDELSEAELLQRNTILDHLLARFNIKFPMYTEVPYSKKEWIRCIRTKEKCLQNIPQLTANRSMGSNLKRPQWGTSNIATASKWLHLYMGYQDYTLKSVTKSIQELQYKLLKKNQQFKEEYIKEILLKGTNNASYSIVKNRRYYIAWLILDNTRLYLGKRNSKIKAKKIIANYQKTIEKANSNSNRFYLLENYRVQKDAVFTVSLFFPSWTHDLQSNHFKEFIKLQAVEVLPTHIHAKFYALPYEEMQQFEIFYQNLEQYPNRTFLNISKQYKNYEF